MTGLLIVLLVLAGLFCLYLFLIAPNEKRKDMSAYSKVLYAHRGLYDNETDAPENSLAAFQKAIDAGFGMELDVQLSKDGHLMVFHDDTLERMCAKPGRVSDYTMAELQNIRLAKSGQTIPTFDQVLTLVAGQQPMIVEIKPYKDVTRLTQMTAARLDEYHGLYCIESFHPLAVRWYKKNHPAIVRGQLALGKTTKGHRLRDFALSRLLINVISRPDFIAYEAKHDYNLSMRLMRGVFKPGLAAYTVRSQQELERNKSRYQVQIFEAFLPR